MTLREGLGYSRLSLQEQHAYKIILKAFSAIATSFDSSQIDRKVDVMKIIQVVLGDHPSVIYFNKTQIKMVSSMIGKRIQLLDCLSRAKTVKMNSEMNAKADSIVALIQQVGGDEFSQIIQVYEYLQKNVKYDEQELLEVSKGRSRRPSAHNAYGALIDGLAVCDGFSGAFTFLAQKLGFECMMVSGYSSYQSTGLIEHAWNVVKVRNRFYHMDVTWDTNLYNEFGEYSYDYFALEDEEIISDHAWNINTTPACSYNDLLYFLKNGLYANNKEQLSDMFRAMGKSRHVPVRVKLSLNIALPENAGEHLAQMLLKEAVKVGASAQLSYRWNEHTRCFFAKFVNI